jgi:hypothetical protein
MDIRLRRDGETPDRAPAQARRQLHALIDRLHDDDLEATADLVRRIIASRRCGEDEPVYTAARDRMLARGSA